MKYFEDLKKLLNRDKNNKTAEQYIRDNGHVDVASYLEKLAAAGNG